MVITLVRVNLLLAALAVATVVVALHRSGQIGELGGVYVAHSVGDLLDTADLEALAFLYGFYEACRLLQ